MHLTRGVMTTSTNNYKFLILSELAAEFRKHGIQVVVKRDSVCIGRPTWDKYSKTFLTMLSARPAIRIGEKGFEIYLTEQQGKVGSVLKYGINLSDDGGTPVRAYHLDTKRGPHVHDFDGKRQKPGHERFSRKMPTIVNDILSRMRAY